jgi:hypothetical protein
LLVDDAAKVDYALRQVDDLKKRLDAYAEVRVMLDAKKIDAAVSAVEAFKSRVDRYADGVNNVTNAGILHLAKRTGGEAVCGNRRAHSTFDRTGFEQQDPSMRCVRCNAKLEVWNRIKASRGDAEESKAREHKSKETTHNKETRQSKDGEKHVVETKQTSEPQQDDPPDPEAKATSGESKAAVNALKTKIAQDKKLERYAKDDAMKPDPNMSAEKMDRMVNTTEKLMGRMDAYMDRAKADDYGHPVKAGLGRRVQETDRQILRGDDTTTEERIHRRVEKSDPQKEDEESDARGGSNPKADA